MYAAVSVNAIFEVKKRKSGWLKIAGDMEDENATRV